nr:alpha/beta fold hydrolase [Rhizobium leguminosarum]
MQFFSNGEEMAKVTEFHIVTISKIVRSIMDSCVLSAHFCSNTKAHGQMMINLSIFTLASAILLATEAVFAAEPTIIRTDRFVDLPAGERLFVREVRRADRSTEIHSVVLLIHGARVPGVASFDLPVPGGSLAADLAVAGHLVYILDLRGYGASSRPNTMEQDPSGSAPLMRTDDAVADIAAAVDAVLKWSGNSQVSILGWATGGHWAGAFAAKSPQMVERLVLYNTLYGGTSEHETLGHGSPLEDPLRPGRFNVSAFGAYRLNTRASLFPAWDNSIPIPEKPAWRDERVAQAYADAALASDPTSDSRQPPSFRSPSGAMADSFELAIGKRQWSASALGMPVLVIRASRDFWSRPQDAQALVDEAPQAGLATISDATHFVHLDRDHAGRATFLAAVTRFLDPSTIPPKGD